MKKRKVLLAALLVCFTMSLQQANASNTHLTNQDLSDQEYTDYSSTEGGVLKVDENNTNNVTGSTLKNNTASLYGGGIYNAGTVDVKNSTFTENTTKRYDGRAEGGAIYNTGTLNVENSTFTGNVAGQDDRYWMEEGHGGAIYNNKEATIKNSTFTGNHARYGGALYNRKDANLTVQGTFKDNTAQTGGAIYNDEGSVTVESGSTFENNKATRLDGGAIVNNDGTLNIGDNVTFKNNSAFDTVQGEEDTLTLGGAIHAEGDGNSNVSIGKGATFEGNQAQEGGAVGLFKHNNVTVGDNATFRNNKAGRDGGAIRTYSIVSDPKASTFEIGDNALFEGNEAGIENESGEGYLQNVVFGGAISATADSNCTEKNTFTIGDNAVFRNNKAGAVSSSLSGYGGAVYNSMVDVTIGNNALFEGNEATLYGGAIYSDGKTSIGSNARFIGNATTVYGGAIYNNQNSTLTIGDNSLFEGNSAVGASNGNTYGGAIGNNGDVTIGNNAKFTNNKSDLYGGAIYNSNKMSIGENASFKGNSAKYGGALANYMGTVAIGENASFEGNSASSMGGAIFNWAEADSTLNIKNATFRNNSSSAYGGAIYGYSGKIDIENTIFSGNKATDGGAAIANQATVDVKNSTFENNTSGDLGGAIYNTSQNSTVASLTVDNSRFTSNKAHYGGAIATHGDATKTDIKNSLFNNNSATLYVDKESADPNHSGEGGAIWLDKGNGNTSVTSSTFANNTADVKGGAIASYSDVTLTDTSFTNNKAGEKGGAIWTRGDVTVKANENNVVFAGNSAKDGADIYMDTTSAGGSKTGTLTLNAAQDKSITLADGISGAQEYNVTINGDGTVTFNGEIKNANMEVTKGTLHLAEGSSLGEGTSINVKNATMDAMDGRINDYSGGKVNIGNGSKLKFDLKSSTMTTDKFTLGKELTTGNITVEDFNFIPDTIVSSGTVTLAELKNSLGLQDAVELQLPEKSYRALTPLRYVNIESSGNGISYMPTGSSYRDFNPAVMAAPVAAQLGGYLTQLDSYDEAFRNIDMYMIMPKSMREAMKHRNQYASSDPNMAASYDKDRAQYDNTAVWARPYATFENVRLKHGPKVSNVAWGTYLGGESEMYQLKNGWEGMWGAYAGYNGSHQAFDGVSIYQNGGTLGLTGALYRNNFFTALTANVGANAAEASTRYGDDSFALLRTGIASKTGYNFEFADGKFIVQPSWLMSYSFVATGDYTTSSGIRVNSDPLNAMHIEPGLKFIGNGSKGWQPYAGLSIVWNFLDKTDFTASDATLPELSVKPFFKYGVGIRKLYGERFVGYGQVYITNGGRNGVGLQFGGRWTL